MATKKMSNVIDDIHYLINEESPFVVTESFRNLMSNISFAVPKKEEGLGKVICISSAITHEGKTTVSTNLAITFATAGYKTVLVDCDMRKPKVGKAFNLPKDKGLVNYLSGQAEFDDILQKDVRPNLDIVATYKTAPNPNALFNSDEFNTMLNKLEKEYEYVIIDTPPVNVVADGVVVSAKCDGVVLVTRQNVSDHKAIQAAINSLVFAEANFLGFVANNIEISKKNKKYYYNKYYKYEYKERNKEEGSE